MLTSFLFRSHSIIKTRHQPTLLDTCPDENVEWTHVSCGVGHSAALTKEGEVYTWGSNNGGQLGHGDDKPKDVPTKITSLRWKVIKVECGEHHTAALTDKGKLFTWSVLHSTH